MTPDITAHFRWTREPAAHSIRPDRITITTAPHTDLKLTERAWKAHDGQKPDEAV